LIYIVNQVRLQFSMISFSLTLPKASTIEARTFAPRCLKLRPLKLRASSPET